MIAVTFALPTESSDVVRQLTDKRNENRNGIATIRGAIDHKEIVILHTGVGPRISRSRMENFFTDAHYEFLVSCGFAGAVTDLLRVGDLIVAENFSDPELLRTAQQVLAPVHTGRLTSSSTIADLPVERDAIARADNAIAVDMETETIAEVCRQRGIPMLSLRVISDSPRAPFPVPPDILFDIDRQKTDAGKLLLHLAKHPAALWPLLRFAGQIRGARRNLTHSLIRLLQNTGTEAPFPD